MNHGPWCENHGNWAGANPSIPRDRDSMGTVGWDLTVGCGWGRSNGRRPAMKPPSAIAGMASDPITRIERVLRGIRVRSFDTLICKSYATLWRFSKTLFCKDSWPKPDGHVSTGRDRSAGQTAVLTGRRRRWEPAMRALISQCACVAHARFTERVDVSLQSRVPCRLPSPKRGSAR